eukprot:TRINITY_DN21609_c0_g1_i1.p1 TRINITY_DN21609_c0_g1~~TRINITY_DN21609_c0_g1_i1.p1  ORF type:complete len:519 (-),score=113.23 TRINITY_DN21609_c0_g1_i1:136-1692(-)
MATRARHHLAFVLTGALAVATLSVPRAWITAGGISWRPNLRSNLDTSVHPRALADERPMMSDGNADTSRGQALLGLTSLASLCMFAATATRSRKSGTSSSICCKAVECTNSDEIMHNTLEAPSEWEETEVETPVEVITRGELVRGAGLAGTAGVVASTIGAEAAEAKQIEANWVQYDLNTGETLYDIDFDPLNYDHGFIVGARGLFYETKDGGKRWVSRSFANLGKAEDILYRFQTVSVYDQDVWIVGKPPLLLHSKDAGKSWKKVPLSKKLPGEPKVIVALGPGKAEIATSSGAIYITENDGKNWKSQVEETVDATLNRVSASGVQGASYFTGSVKSLKRNPDSGKYLAVAQRGNFYLTFNPKESPRRWVPHNRISARRIQAMGFHETGDDTPTQGVWMTLNGGYFTNAPEKGYDDFGTETKEIFKNAEIRTGGIGIIDCAFRTEQEGWATGGTGVIYNSKDGGKSWTFDPSAKQLPCNLYSVKFFNNSKVGYMLGSAGILLRRSFDAANPDVPKQA